MGIAEAVDRLLADESVERIRQPVVEVVGPDGAWLVGGSVRDAILARPVTDLDLVVDADPAAVARAVASATGGAVFELSDEFATWRVVPREGDCQVDVAALRAGGIEGDLELRDFTLGAIAVELAGGGLLDPTGGAADLEAGVLRAVSDRSFTDDPLRVMRVPRLAAQFGWEVEGRTTALAIAAAPELAGVAGERALAEFLLILSSRDPLGGFETMDAVGAVEALMPELSRMKGVTQGPNHHRDVWGHTLEVLEGVLRIESELDRFVGEEAGEVAELLAEPLADGVDRGTGLRLGALFHDCAKPETRTERDGLVGFRGHDELGATLVERIFGRLRSSRNLARHVASLTRDHLVLGFMVHEMPLDPYRVHAYLRRTDPSSVDVTLLTIADRLAARGSGPVASSEMVAAHLELASGMVGEGLRWRRQGPPRLPIAGDELARQVGIEPGPELGSLIERIEGAVWAGDVETASDAVELAREVLSAG